MEGAFKLNSCSEEFSKLNIDTHFQHQKVCDSKKKDRKCNVSGFDFSKEHDLVNNIRKHIGERPFNCKISGCAVGSTGGIKYKHSNEREFCNEELNSFAKISVQNNPVRDIKKNFKCKVCCRKSSTGQHLVYHMRTHTGERPYKCKVSGCEKSFKQESSMKTHVKFKHTDERPFTCGFPGCLHTFKTATDLKTHMKVHSNKRPFPCLHSGCNFQAKLKHNLTQHTANVHSESKLLTCSKCKYATNISGRLSRHLIVHERSIKKIPCSIRGCEYKGKNCLAFKEHMRRHNTLLPFQVSRCGQYACTYRKSPKEPH